MLNAEAWSQFVKDARPTIQGLMSSYLEQSANTFLDMQQQLQKQARSIFATSPSATSARKRQTTSRMRPLPTPTASINRRRKPAEAPIHRESGAGSMIPRRFHPLDSPMTAVKTRKPPAVTPRVGSFRWAVEGAGRFRAHPHPLRAEGYLISGSYRNADLVVVNTCGFIDAAVRNRWTRSVRRWRRTAKSSSPAAWAPRAAWSRTHTRGCWL